MTSSPDEHAVRRWEDFAARRLQHDELMWQVPGLSLTAQAFLFTIALGPGSSAAARLLASGLAVAATVISIQLLARHRAIEIHFSEQLQAWEQQYGLEEWDFPRGGEVKLQRGPRVVRWMSGQSSYLWWVYGLAAFGTVGLTAFVLAAGGWLLH